MFTEAKQSLFSSPHNKEVGASTSLNSPTSLTDGAVLTRLHDPLEDFRSVMQVSEVY